MLDIYIWGKTAYSHHLRDADSYHYRSDVPCCMAAQMQEVVALLKEHCLIPLLSETELN